MDCTRAFMVGKSIWYHYYGIRIIQKLQCYLEPTIPFFEFISIITRPAVAYYFIFPVAFFIGPQLGLSVLWSAIISEAMNLFLKTILQGDRPYWWVREHAKEHCNLNIRQYPSTCEISPGTPSGHALISSAVWTSILLVWCNCAPETCAKRRTKILSFIVIHLICISRVIIGAHFPHQVLLGLFLGMAIAHLLSLGDCYKNSPINYFRVAILLLILALISKYIFPNIGMCHCWSVIKAKKYCNNASWVRKFSAKPFSSYLKLASIFIGTGLSMLIILALKDFKVHLNSCVTKRFLSTMISLIITSFLYFKMSKYGADGPPGYALIILKNMMIPLSTIVFVPLACDMYHS